jgi:hypothetical protein
MTKHVLSLLDYGRKKFIDQEIESAIFTNDETENIVIDVRLIIIIRLGIDYIDNQDE